MTSTLNEEDEYGREKDNNLLHKRVHYTKNAHAGASGPCLEVIPNSDKEKWRSQGTLATTLITTTANGTKGLCLL